MRLLSRLTGFWQTLFRRDALDRELDDEIQAVVETLEDRYAANGMSREAARRAAVAALGGTGGITRAKEDVHDGRIGAGLESLLVDIRQAWRGLLKAPGLTLVVAVTLALGIGANVAIFTIVHALLLEPLPYRHADRLVFVWLDGREGYRHSPMSGPDLGDLRRGSRAIDSFGAIWATGAVALTGDGDPEQLRAAYVTDNFFDVLGAEPALGRVFRPEDSAPGAHPTILIGWDLFTRRFGADPSIVGRDIIVNDESTTVIGVMPRTFRLLMPPDASVPDRLQVWQPFWPQLEVGPRGNLFLRVVGRMRPGVRVEQARADVDAIGGRITQEIGSQRVFSTVELQADNTRELRGPLLILFAGVGVLLAIACVNVASLLIARAAARAHETALRLALGASRARLLRQLLVEGLLLTGLGAVGGVLVGAAGLRALLALAPESLSRIDASRIDLTVLAFTMTIAVAWGLLFSLAPATELFKVRAEGSLRPHARSTGTPVRYRVRAALVVAQVALSLVLLIGAGLLVRAFVAVQRVHPGFQADRHLTFRVALPYSRYRTTEAVLAGDTALRQRLASMRGVTGVGAISHLPYDDLPNWSLLFKASIAVRNDESMKADARAVTQGLFETLGVQLVEGRLFTDTEYSNKPDRGPRKDVVVVIDDLLAQRLWPGRSAIGQSFLLGQATPDHVVMVVGVIRHLRLRSLVEDLSPQVFLSYRQWQRSPMAYVVRADRDPAELVSDVRAAMTAFDPQLPIYDVRPLMTYVEAARSIRWFTMLLAAAFAASALALTCIGVYGVLAYAVAVRRHEFGVRRVLGADTAQVLHAVLREGLGCAIAGSLGGTIGAALAAGLLRSQLYAVHPHDPLTYGTALALILGGAALACWIPARRATTVSPLDALRTE